MFLLEPTTSLAQSSQVELGDWDWSTFNGFLHIKGELHNHMYSAGHVRMKARVYNKNEKRTADYKFKVYVQGNEKQSFENSIYVGEADIGSVSLEVVGFDPI